MDFFERQDNARRKTHLLIVYFIAAVVFIVLAVYVIAAFIYSAAVDRPRDSIADLWDPTLFMYVSAGTLGLIGIASAFKSAQLGRDGGAVARALGGRLLDPATEDLHERKLLNVVEEMAIASGVPVPEVYLLEDEQGINAFAAGHTPENAAIGVTAGCMRLLTRDELQGVIAHEFSHIFNGDMRLNVRIIGLLFGILVISVVGRILIRATATRGRRKVHPAVLLGGLGLIVVGYFGVLFGRLIQSAVSRQREYLADAAAVQYTRNPPGIAGALKKIGGLSEGSRLANPHAQETGHLFFGNALGKAWVGLMSTHPPLVERIRAIDPAFDGVFPRVSLPDAPPPPAGDAATRARKQRPPVLIPPGLASNLAPETAGGISVEETLKSVGVIQPDHLHRAQELHGSLPPALLQAAHESGGAVALVLSLLLSQDESVRSQQIKAAELAIEPSVVSEAVRLRKFVTTLPGGLTLPLFDLALPALRLISADQYRRLNEAVRVVIETDSEIDLLEYTVQTILHRNLGARFEQQRRRVVQYYAIGALRKECSVLLAALAHLGHDEEQAKQQAFAAGAAELNVPLEWRELEQCGLDEVDAALQKLADLAPALKKKMLAACARTVAVDGKIRPGEAQLLRAVCEALDCPLPLADKNAGAPRRRK